MLTSTRSVEAQLPITPAVPVAGPIKILSGTYGGNCKQPAGNKTPHIAQACTGKASCDYVVDYQVIGDPAYGCAKDYVAEYTCGSDPTVRRASASPEAGFKTTVSLSCGSTKSPGDSRPHEVGAVVRCARIPCPPERRRSGHRSRSSSAFGGAGISQIVGQSSRS